MPMSLSSFHSHPSPVLDYSAAVERIQARQAAELATPGFYPDLQSCLLTHGKKTQRVVVWLHGYTSAPPYFQSLAEECFRRGDNAFLPCAPHHGFADRMTQEVSRLNSVELVRFIDEMVDLTRGLGEEVIVAGISMGGTLAAWAAHERADVSLAVVLEPFLGAHIIPTRLTGAAMFLARLIPDIKVWWDAEKKENCDGEPYGYPRYSIRSIGQLGQLGGWLLARSRRSPPAARQVWVVLNEHDGSVNNELVERLVERWTAAGGKNVHLHRFADALGLPHDCLSTLQPNGKPELVAAELMKMIG